MRSRLLALGAIVAVALVALAVTLIATGGSDTPARTAPTPAQPQDPYAADRAAIQRVAETWRRSLNPKSPDNPCRYMAEQYRLTLQVEMQGGPRALTCPQAVRRALNQGDVPLYQATLGGLAHIAFSSNVPVQGTPSTAPGAQGTWRAEGYPPASFVRRAGEWKVAG